MTAYVRLLFERSNLGEQALCIILKYILHDTFLTIYMLKDVVHLVQKQI